MRTDFSTLRKLMNEFGQERKPFVFAVDYDMQQCLFVADPLNCSDIRWATECANNGSADVEPPRVAPELKIVHTPTAEDYAQKFVTVRSGLMHGYSFLANLTLRAEVECNATFDELFSLCDAKYKLLIPNEFICFSPESFVKIANGKIHTFPMKGTIDATEPNAESRLMSSHKELCEHNTIVDLLRNDLSMVADGVKVSRFRYIDRIKTQRGEILQTSSEIEGTLPGDWHGHVGDILARLLPAGSICGAPKAATVQLIANAEQLPRGWYTGVFGYFDGATLDSAVMIRCLAKDGDKTYFHSGGGITVNSRCDDEFNEVLQKIYLPTK